jgi:hypothetical protein
MMRVHGHAKVMCHLMFGILAVTSSKFCLTGVFKIWSDGVSSKDLNRTSLYVVCKANDFHAK